MGRFGIVSAVFLVAVLSGTAMAYSTSIMTRMCSSTGGPSDYDVFGVTRDAYGNHSDACVNATHVMKWYCDNGFAKADIHECPNGCVDDECFAESPNEVAYGYVCTATVPDRNLQIRGVVDGNETDTCINSNLVKKWYCWHNIEEFAVYDCPYGCKNGACKRSGEKNGYDYYQYLDISIKDQTPEEIVVT